jgi:ADP-ribose pyrophosphatase YjhB (NUDIX family)
MLDEADRVLLVRFDRVDQGRRWWAPVGGGLNPGESHEVALAREITEETGLREFTIGPWIWYREVGFEWQGKNYLQQERFYLVRVRAFEPVGAWADAEERALVGEIRWWTLEAMEASAEVMSPTDLARLLRELIQTGLVLAPREIGV